MLKYPAFEMMSLFIYLFLFFGSIQTVIYLFHSESRYF